MRIKIIAILAFIVCNVAFADDADDAGAKLYEYFAIFNEKDVHKVANTIYPHRCTSAAGLATKFLLIPTRPSKV